LLPPFNYLCKSANIYGMENNWNIQTHNDKKVRRVRICISVILSISGLVILASQVIPLTKSYVDGVVEQKRVDVKVDPVPESYKKYIQEEFAYYDPGLSYFANLSQQLGDIDLSGYFSYNPETQSQRQVVIDKDYKNDMSVTVESVGIKDIVISSNVESSNEAVYNQYLKRGVAHFKGTPLPGDGGNSFIYGHSAVESFFSRNRDLPETIFSRLNNIDIGQKVVVKRDDKVLEYTVRNKKIVEPDDFSILQPVHNKETITLMTCWPLGLGTKRLIVVAERR
jgi:LPXTG-site transpeptidase (sortase) family protein